MQQLPLSTKKYQVYFFTCPAHRPFRFAVHSWIVTVKNQEINRYEIIHKQIPEKEPYGYVYKNYYSNPVQGIKKYPGSDEYWDSTIIGSTEGPLAKRMIEFIENYSPDYLHKDRYNIYPGPNSNTYIQWILSKFPEAEIKLPWNAFGKKYLK